MRRILFVLAIAALTAAMMVVMAAPAVANDGGFNGLRVGDHGFRDHDDDDEDVDIERERFGNVECVLVIEEDGDEEELEDAFCFPRRGAFHHFG
jgi:hypothetical protein